MTSHVMSRIVTYYDRKANVVTVIFFAKPGYVAGDSGAAGDGVAGAHLFSN
jgi:hypothetical protein